MKTKKLNIILLVLLLICTAVGCHSRQKPDIRPHPVNLSADSFYQQAVAILQSSYDVDSTRKCISLLDRALSIDSLNPDYYGTKAKLLAEMGELDYVNDDRYAEARAHSLLAARKSRRAAAQNLRQKGLSGAQIEQALESVYAPDADGESPELEAAAALVRSRYMKKLADGRRDLVVAALQRRGFAYSVIKEAIKRAEEE